MHSMLRDASGAVEMVQTTACTPHAVALVIFLLAEFVWKITWKITPL